MCFQAIGAVASVVGTGLAVVSATKQASAEKKAVEAQNTANQYSADASEQNAVIALDNKAFAEKQGAAAEIQALDAEQRGRDEATLYRQRVRGLLGKQKASYAAAGVVVNKGTPEVVYGDTVRAGEIDAAIILENAKREATGYRYNAEGYRQSAKNFDAQSKGAATLATMYQGATVAPSNNAMLYGTTSLITGIGTIADRWSKLNSPGLR